MRDSVSLKEILDYIETHPYTDKTQIVFDLHIFPDTVSRMVEFLVGSGQIRREYNCYKVNGK